MKTEILGFLGRFRGGFSSWKRWVLLAVLTFCLIPPFVRADGISDILSLFQTITHTLEGPIGGVLNEMQKLNAAINNSISHQPDPLVHQRYAGALHRPDVAN